LFSIQDVQGDENSRPLHAQPGSHRAVGGHKENLFSLVKFKQADTHKHVLVLDEEFTFDYEEHRKKMRASRIQVDTTHVLISPLSNTCFRFLSLWGGQ
jgi:hypothetical protein